MSNGLGFWKNIAEALRRTEDDAPKTTHQRRRTKDDAPTTFDEVRDVLDVYGDPDGVGTHTDDTSFFAGSGGEDRLFDALEEAGWVTLWVKAWYHYAARHPQTGETLTYVEGDVYRGDRGHL